MYSFVAGESQGARWGSFNFNCQRHHSGSSRHSTGRDLVGVRNPWVQDLTGLSQRVHRSTQNIQATKSRNWLWKIGPPHFRASIWFDSFARDVSLAWYIVPVSGTLILPTDLVHIDNGLCAALGGLMRWLLAFVLTTAFIWYMDPRTLQKYSESFIPYIYILDSYHTASISPISLS